MGSIYSNEDAQRLFLDDIIIIMNFESTLDVINTK